MLRCNIPNFESHQVLGNIAGIPIHSCSAGLHVFSELSISIFLALDNSLNEVPGKGDLKVLDRSLGIDGEDVLNIESLITAVVIDLSRCESGDTVEQLEIIG